VDVLGEDQVLQVVLTCVTAYDILTQIGPPDDEHFLLETYKVKVKQSHYRPGVAQRVAAS
jgi:hypothetical protein